MFLLVVMVVVMMMMSEYLYLCIMTEDIYKFPINWDNVTMLLCELCEISSCCVLLEVFYDSPVSLCQNKPLIFLRATCQPQTTTNNKNTLPSPMGKWVSITSTQFPYERRSQSHIDWLSRRISVEYTQLHMMMTMITPHFHTVPKAFLPINQYILKAYCRLLSFSISIANPSSLPTEKSPNIMFSSPNDAQHSHTSAVV